MKAFSSQVVLDLLLFHRTHHGAKHDCQPPELGISHLFVLYHELSSSPLLFHYADPLSPSIYDLHREEKQSQGKNIKNSSSHLKEHMLSTHQKQLHDQLFDQLAQHYHAHHAVIRHA